MWKVQSCCLNLNVTFGIRAYLPPTVIATNEAADDVMAAVWQAMSGQWDGSRGHGNAMARAGHSWLPHAKAGLWFAHDKSRLQPKGVH